jgi:hypothetical protein
MRKPKAASICSGASIPKIGSRYRNVNWIDFFKKLKATEFDKVFNRRALGKELLGVGQRHKLSPPVNQKPRPERKASHTSEVRRLGITLLLQGKTSEMRLYQSFRTCRDYLGHA